MAYLYKKTYTVTDPETGKKTKRKGKKWRIRFRDPDGIILEAVEQLTSA